MKPHLLDEVERRVVTLYSETHLNANQIAALARTQTQAIWPIIRKRKPKRPSWPRQHGLLPRGVLTYVRLPALPEEPLIPYRSIYLEQDKAKAVHLWKLGVDKDAIATRLKRTKQTIGNWLAEAEAGERGPYRPLKRRPRKPPPTRAELKGLIAAKWRRT